MNRLFTSYKYELQKLIVVRKGWILLLGVILVQLGIALFAAPSQEYVFDKGLYAEYTELYGGEYSEETSVKINEELQEVDTIVNETDLSQITDAEQIEALSEQMILASMKRNALSALQSKYAELSECREYSPILTYDLELNEYISRFGFNWASLVGMLIIIPMLMLGDKNCGMEQILFPTSTGRKAIVCSKLLVGATIGLSMTAVCSALQFIIMALRWDWRKNIMPFIDSKVTVKMTEQQKEEIKTELGRLIATLGKSESYLMVGIEDAYDLWLAGKKLEKGAYVAVSLYGSAPAAAYDKLTGQICGLLSQKLGIPGSAVYVTYHPVNDWGWNGSNF